MSPPLASLGSDLSQFFDSVGTFFSNLAGLSWGPLLLALLCYAAYLTLRSRALFNAVQAAYPAEHVRWREVWGAYVAGVGVNQVFPLGGGTLVQYFLTRISIPASSYPAIIAAIWTGLVFDWGVNLLVLAFAFTQGVFPKPPDFSKLPAFDLAFLASHPRFTLFLLTALAVAALVAFALLSVRVKAFWARVRQGFTILTDRDRYLREMVELAGRRRGSRASRRTGSCSRRSTSAARCATCCSCSASRSSRCSSRSRPAEPACSRRCC